MKRICSVAAVLLFAGCGVQPSGVTDGGDAPTGVAPGVTLYFVGPGDELRAQQRPTERLGSISEAMALLLSGPGAGLRTRIGPTTTTQVVVTTGPDVIELTVPLTIQDVTPLGIDQIVCTALGVHVQSGGSKDTKVRIRFVQPAPESGPSRACPLIK